MELGFEHTCPVLKPLLALAHTMLLASLTPSTLEFQTNSILCPSHSLGSEHSKEGGNLSFYL